MASNRRLRVSRTLSADDVGTVRDVEPVGVVPSETGVLASQSFGGMPLGGTGP